MSNPFDLDFNAMPFTDFTAAELKVNLAKLEPDFGYLLLEAEVPDAIQANLASRG